VTFGFVPIEAECRCRAREIDGDKGVECARLGLELRSNGLRLAHSRTGCRSETVSDNRALQRYSTITFLESLDLVQQGAVHAHIVDGNRNSAAGLGNAIPCGSALRRCAATAEANASWQCSAAVARAVRKVRIRNLSLTLPTGSTPFCHMGS
jgi:hypothetical protein